MAEQAGGGLEIRPSTPAAGAGKSAQAWCGACARGSQPRSRAASGPALGVRRPLREELAAWGCAGLRTQEARTGAEKCRSRAPRGAPAGVIGRRSLAIRRSVRSRGGPPGAAASAPAPVGALLPSFFQGAGKTKGTRPCRSGLRSVGCLTIESETMRERAAHSNTLPWRGRVGEHERSDCEPGWGETSQGHPTPTLTSFAPTLPLQGRVKAERVRQ